MELVCFGKATFPYHPSKLKEGKAGFQVKPCCQSQFPSPSCNNQCLQMGRLPVSSDRVNPENQVENPFDTHLCLLIAVSVLCSLKCKWRRFLYHLLLLLNLGRRCFISQFLISYFYPVPPQEWKLCLGQLWQPPVTSAISQGSACFWTSWWLFEIWVKGHPLCGNQDGLTRWHGLVTLSTHQWSGGLLLFTFLTLSGWVVLEERKKDTWTCAATLYSGKRDEVTSVLFLLPKRGKWAEWGSFPSEVSSEIV